MSSTASTRRVSRKLSREVGVLERMSSMQRAPDVVAEAQAAAKSLGVHYADKLRARESAAGFILADEEGNPIYANSEAKAILSYPEGPRGFLSAWAYLRKAIFPWSGQHSSSAVSTSRLATMSGRRKYVCLAIPLDKPLGLRTVGGSVAIVLERHREASCTVAETMSDQFHLTEREQEVLEFLIRGLTNKEIAARMQLSPNTVRAFVRMIMGKLGIWTRSGVVGMVFRNLHSLPPWNSEQNQFRKS